MLLALYISKTECEQDQMKIANEWGTHEKHKASAYGAEERIVALWRIACVECSLKRASTEVGCFNS